MNDARNTFAMLQFANMIEALIANAGVNLARWHNVSNWCAFILVMHGFLSLIFIFGGFPLAALFCIIGSALLHFILFRYAKRTVALNTRLIQQIKEQNDKLISTPPPPTRSKARPNVAFH